MNTLKNIASLGGGMSGKALAVRALICGTILFLLPGCDGPPNHPKNLYDYMKQKGLKELKDASGGWTARIIQKDGKEALQVDNGVILYTDIVPVGERNNAKKHGAEDNVGDWKNYRQASENIHQAHTSGTE